MKIELEKSDLQTLDQDKKGLYSYSIMTRKGLLTVEGIESPENAIINAEMHVKDIVKAMLSKKNVKRKTVKKP